LDLLKKVCGLTREFVVADVGSGTGILFRLSSEHGDRVFRSGAERRNAPGREVAAVGVRALRRPRGDGGSHNAPGPEHGLRGGRSGFPLVRDAEKTRAAFVRVLRPGGWTLLERSVRHKMGTLFLEAYERRLLTFGTDYEGVEHLRGWSR